MLLLQSMLSGSTTQTDSTKKQKVSRIPAPKGHTESEKKKPDSSRECDESGFWHKGKNAVSAIDDNTNLHPPDEWSEQGRLRS